jgi:glycosyltransferase involved in cell wall biosynthesis
LDQSLSIVLSVHNAEKTLTTQVVELLEVLPELTSQFELLILDDGSTDHTDEVAHDLARRFPQLQVARHAQQRGAAAAVTTGLEHTSGDVLFVQDGQMPMSPCELRRLWGMRQDKPKAAAEAQRGPGAISRGLMKRLTAWGAGLEDGATLPSSGEEGSGVRMIRRRKAGASQKTP